MANENTNGNAEINVNRDNLYREETYTDGNTASFRKLVPVHVDGTDDESRTPIFLGQTYVVTQAGPVPVQAQLDNATTLEEAIDQFPEAAEKALQEMVAQAKTMKEQQEQMQRQSPREGGASKIILPS